MYLMGILSVGGVSIGHRWGVKWLQQAISHSHALSLSVFLSLAHTHTHIHDKKKKALIFSVCELVHTPQPSDNLLPCVYRVFGAKVSLNLSPQSQTPSKPQRNNVYFLSAAALFLTMLSERGELVYLTDSPAICSSIAFEKVTERILCCV